MENKTAIKEQDMRDAVFDSLYSVALKDKNIILLLGDQGAKSFEKFKENIPDQIINAGPAEQNLISVASGLALGGKKVFVHAIACFITARCYEQIKIDIGIMNLPVSIIGIGGGYSYESDGPTHHSIQDISIMKGIPGMTILSASDPVQASSFVDLCCRISGPSYLRFDKGVSPFLYEKENFDAGFSLLREGEDTIIISSGSMTHTALEVADKINAGLIDLYRIKPLNEALLSEILKKARIVVAIEDHLSYGGVGTSICDLLCDYGITAKFKRFGIKDKECFCYGDKRYMCKEEGLDAESIIKQIKNII